MLERLLRHPERQQLTQEQIIELRRRSLNLSYSAFGVCRFSSEVAVIRTDDLLGRRVQIAASEIHMDNVLKYRRAIGTLLPPETVEAETAEKSTNKKVEHIVIATPDVNFEEDSTKLPILLQYSGDKTYLRVLGNDTQIMNSTVIDNPFYAPSPPILLLERSIATANEQTLDRYRDFLNDAVWK